MKQVYLFNRYGADQSFVVADKELADAIARLSYVDYKTVPMFAEGALYRPLDEVAGAGDEEADGDAIEF